MRELYQNILSIIMTVMLVVGLCPGIALARPNESNGELVLGTSGALVAPETSAISEKSAEALQALTGDGSEIVQAVVKTGHSAAITSDGSLWMWGENYYGSIGDGTTESCPLPKRVMVGVVQVSLGDRRTAALKSDGTLWAWGKDAMAPTYSHRHIDENSPTTPTMIMDDVVETAWGDTTAAAIRSDGSLWMWGENGSGQVDPSISDSWITTPTCVMRDVAHVAVGSENSAAIKIDGSLWMWGDNADGQLGIGSKEAQQAPVKVMDGVSSVTLGLSASCSAAIKIDGSLWTWGSNNNGRLGDGTTVDRSLPNEIMDDVVSVSIGTISGAVKTDGSLWTWGAYNENIPLGDGSTDDRYSPGKIMNGAAKMQCGYTACSALRSDGSLWVWGSEQYSLKSESPQAGISPICIFKNGEWLYGSNESDYYGEIFNSGVSTVLLGQDFESCVTSTASTEYNPELSHYLSCLSRAAYSEPDVSRSLSSMGFDTGGSECFDASSYANNEITVAYSVAVKTLQDGKKLALVTIRGTFEPQEWASNALYGPAARIGLGKHAGFENDANIIYESLVRLQGGLQTSNVTYVITGHSQGAAAGNLLAVKLHDQGVPIENVYDYNYACPNVACLLNPLDWNPDGVHDNIFNIGNVEDPVTFLPGNVTRRFSPLSVLPSTWGKFGKSYWFLPSDDNRSPAGHDMKHYVRALQQREPIGAFCQYGQIPVSVIRTALGIHCPVDVVVYDSGGNPVAGVVGNEEQYYDTEFGETVVLVNDDEKLIILPEGSKYDVRLTATGAGEMTYGVSREDLASQDAETQKAFESVALMDGKLLRSETGGDISVPNTKLYVLGDGLNVAEVLEDGTEVSIEQVSDPIASGTWGTCPWEIDADGVLTVHPGTGGDASVPVYSESYHSNVNMSYWHDYWADIKAVVFAEEGGDKVVAPMDCGSMFYGLTNMASADLSGLDMSNVTSVGSSWGSSEHSSLGMFEGCASLTTIDLSVVDLSKVVEADSMFKGCASLESVNLHDVSAPALASMSSMFGGCASLEALDLSSFGSSSVQLMDYAFSGCTALTALDLSGITPSSAASADFLFDDCQQLETVVLGMHAGPVIYLPSHEINGRSDWFAASDHAWYSAAEIAESRVNVADTYTKGVSMDLAVISNVASKTYSGQEQTQDLAVSIGSDVLAEGSDYDLTYWNNINAGTAVAVVTGKGEYTGERSVEFSIAPARITQVVLSRTSHVYGAEIDDPTVTVYGPNGALPAWDYATPVRSPDTYSAGEYTYTVVSRSGNCIGSASATYKITPAPIGRATITMQPSSLPYNGKERQPNVRVEDNDGTALVWGVDYITSFSNNVNPGTATVAVTGMGNYTGTTSATFEITQPAVAGVKRLAGGDRYQTMSTIVSEGFASSGYAVVATGENYPDALSANALAGAYECPVVLTEKGSLSGEARATLQRLGVKHAFIMGGEAAVSQATEASIAGMGISVERVAGSDRQDTSLKALAQVKAKTGAVPTVIVATGNNFADTLSIGPWSYANCAPIVLTAGDGRLTAAEVSAIQSLGGAEIVAVGGPAVVSNDVASQLGCGMTRLGGANRYETSSIIAAWEKSRGLGLSAPAVATGENFPDALAGAALCGSKGSIMVLASPSNASAADAVAGASGAYIFGGANAVPASVELRVRILLAS